MLSVEEYADRLLASIRPLDPIELPLADVNGCVLDQDVIAPWPLPSFDNSSMDGYAVIHADIESAGEDSPVELIVVDDVPAGYRSLETLARGQAIRIMTGAPTPAGADCVVPVESTNGGTERIVIRASVDQGAYIRRIGEDVPVGATVLRKGTVLTPRSIALLAAVGQDHVQVIPKPRVAVMSTGTELVEPGVPLTTGLISDSNSFMLVSAARDAGALAYRVPPVQDNEDSLLEVLQDQVHRADLIITTGGVSMGAYDPVKVVFNRLGTAEFHKVAMQPGMPQGFGTIGEQAVPVITLPGNPVSAYVSFETFARPALRKLSGREIKPEHRIHARLTESMKSPQAKCQFARGKFVEIDGELLVQPVGLGQGSHFMGGLAQAECFIVIPVGVSALEAGTQVEVIDIRERHET